MNSVRNTISCKYDYGVTLLNLFIYIPGNVLVFFPSLSYLSDCINEWKKNGLYASFSSVKEVFSETDAVEQEKKRLNEVNRLQNQVMLEAMASHNASSSRLFGSNASPSDPYIELTNKYIQSSKTRKGGVLFAVCRGKASEGIDFSDDLCRCVIVVGIPYPPPNDPYIYLRRQWLNQHSMLTKDEIELGISHRLDDFISKEKIEQINRSMPKNDAYNAILDNLTPKPLNISNNTFSYNVISHNDKYLTGSEWYNQSAFRAINQAIGRVIRHKDDYGCILLMDERYKWGTSKDLLSNWLQTYYQVSNSFRMFFSW